MPEGTQKPSVLDSLLKKGKDFIESDHLKSFSEEAKKIVEKTVDTVKHVDVKEIAEKGKSAIGKGKEFVENFDAKQTVEDIKQVGEDFQKDPDKAVDSTIEKFIGFVARMAGMPDPKTGAKKGEKQTPTSVETPAQAPVKPTATPVNETATPPQPAREEAQEPQQDNSGMFHTPPAQ